MGFTWKGLTTSALVSNSSDSNQANEKDVASVPAAVRGHTSADFDRNDPDNEKIGAPREVSPSDSTDDVNKVDVSAPKGVQVIQASTHVWTKNELITAYIIMWIIQFVLAFGNSIVVTLTPYVTSSFQLHSLTALTNVVSTVVAGIWKLPYAKIMDIWGRPQALCVGVGCLTMGLIMMAGCKNVQTYCAAQVFYYVGYNSISFSLTVFVADTSKLKNRGFFLGYAASPFLITTWVYGYAVNEIIAPGGMGFRWGFGVFSIVIPVVCAPLIVMFFLNASKAKKQGLIPPRHDAGTLSQKAVYYAKEFDVIGMFVLAAGLALFLLSFNLYSYQKDEWKSPLIICFLIFGALLIAAFVLWEKYFAPITFVPWHLLKNRTVIFTYTMAASLYIGWWVWNTYFYSVLIVLYDQSVVHATYISNIYTMGSCFISLVYGYCLRHYGKLKMYSLFWGVPLTILGVGLMIAFRDPNVNIGYIVMCQIFIAFGGGVLVISEQTTLMAVSKQQDFPALLAVEAMAISIGSSVGITVAGAMWTGIFPKRLMQNLPATAMENFPAIYGSLDVQDSYPQGSPERDAISASYGETVRLMLIAATCLYSVTLISVMLWQNVDVRKQKQRTFGLL